MRTIPVIILCAVLAGCDKTQPNQCLREELYKHCLAVLPKLPPMTTQDDNWGEAISQCETSARLISLRATSLIPKECRL